MKTHSLRIATRNSPLALCQAEFIKAQLLAIYPHLQIELLSMTTEGDRQLGMPLATVGGKGLFVKELEQALLEERADIAVHSIKDMPLNLPEGLFLGAICEREDPRDAFVSNHYTQLEQLPKGAIVGTASLRRQCQTLAYRPDLKVVSLRGNVNTRLRRLDAGEFDAIILAGAGLTRLNLTARIQTYLDTKIYLPAVGQGALGIECREADKVTRDMLNSLHHATSYHCVLAERAFNRALSGGCQVPIAGFATLTADKLSLQGMVGRPDGSLVLSGQVTGSRVDAERLGEDLAQQLLAQGAGDILSEVYQYYG